MKMISDIEYKKLSDLTLKELENVFQNCNKNNIADHLFTVFYEAEMRAEIKNGSIFRLAFKALNNFNNKE